MRRLALAALLAIGLSSTAALAQPVNAGENQPHAASPELPPGSEVNAVCTAGSSDEQCAAYWEHHINWFSMDYKASPSQLPEHRHMPPPFAWAILNFLVFAAIMFRLAGKPLKEFLRTRHVSIKKELDEAAALRAAADAKLREYQQKVSGLDGEIEKLLATIRKEAEEDKARIVAAAADHARRLRAEAEAQIKNEVERTKAQLRRDMVEAAVAAAETALREKLSGDDQSKLAARYVTDLEAPATKEARS